MFKALGKAPRRALVANIIRTCTPYRRVMLRYALGCPGEEGGDGEISPRETWIGACKNYDMECVQFLNWTLKWAVPSDAYTWIKFVRHTILSTKGDTLKCILTFLWEHCIGLEMKTLIEVCAQVDAKYVDVSGCFWGEEAFEHLLKPEEVSAFIPETKLLEIAFRHDCVWLFHWTRNHTKGISQWITSALEYVDQMNKCNDKNQYECVQWMMRHIPFPASMEKSIAEFLGLAYQLVDRMEYNCNKNNLQRLYVILRAYMDWYRGAATRISAMVCREARANIPMIADYVHKTFHDTGRCGCSRE